MFAYLCVAIGGALGSVARFALNNLIAPRVEGSLPWATIAVNVSGSLVIGVLAALAASSRYELSSAVRQFLMVGICGGYTTFSSFSLQTMELLQQRHWLAAASNIAVSVVACLAAVWLGYAGTASLISKP